MLGMEITHLSELNKGLELLWSVPGHLDDHSYFSPFSVSPFVTD